MATSTTEKTYPIRSVWILKALTPSVLVAAILLFLISYVDSGNLVLGTQIFSTGELAVVFAIVIILLFIGLMFQKAKLHYFLEEKDMIIKWGGLLSKEQTRDIGYNTIKNISVEQNIFDKVFGIASVRIIGDQKAGWATSYVISVRRLRMNDAAGAFGNIINIPGLSKKDAIALKGVISGKM